MYFNYIFKLMFSFILSYFKYIVVCDRVFRFCLLLIISILLVLKFKWLVCVIMKEGLLDLKFKI